MEFASEIVVKAAQAQLRVTEMPIVYHPRIGESKLNALRDGWRHLRFLLTLSPYHLLFLPGAAFVAGGLATEAGLAFGGAGGLLLAVKVIVALIAVAGAGLMACGVFAGTYSSRHGFDRGGRLSAWVDHRFVLEHGLVAGAVVGGGGLAVMAVALARHSGSLLADPGAVSIVIVAMLLVVMGLQILFGSFLMNLVQLLRHHRPGGDATVEVDASAGGHRASQEGAYVEASAVEAS